MCFDEPSEDGRPLAQRADYEVLTDFADELPLWMTTSLPHLKRLPSHRPSDRLRGRRRRAARHPVGGAVLRGIGARLDRGECVRRGQFGSIVGNVAGRRRAWLIRRINQPVELSGYYRRGYCRRRTGDRLIFIGFHWVKPESLRLSVRWNSMEFELRISLILHSARTARPYDSVPSRSPTAGRAQVKIFMRVVLSILGAIVLFVLDTGRLPGG